MTVQFICRGNAQRSFMAETYLKSLNQPGLNVISSGIVADKYRELNEPTMQKITLFLDEKGIGQFAKKRAEQLTQERLNSADINVCMNQIVKDECDDLLIMPSDTLVWDIDDTNEGNRMVGPGGDHYKYTEEIYQQVKDKVDELVKSLKPTS